MQRIIGIIVFWALAGSFALGQSSKLKDRILWHPDSMPTWEDYLGKAPRSGGYAAMTSAGIEINSYVEEGVQKIKVGAYFYRQKSWVQPDQKADNIYAHELLHFTITELYARKLRKEIYTQGKKDLKKMSEKLNDLFNEMTEKLTREQEKYDKETSGSQNYTKQKEWVAAIQAELDALKEFENPVLEFVY